MSSRLVGMGFGLVFYEDVASQRDFLSTCSDFHHVKSYVRRRMRICTVGRLWESSVVYRWALDSLVWFGIGLMKLLPLIIILPVSFSFFPMSRAAIIVVVHWWIETPVNYESLPQCIGELQIRWFGFWTWFDEMVTISFMICSCFTTVVAELLQFLLSLIVI